MPFLIGPNAIRRTIKYLEQGKLIFRKNVKVMTVHFNNVAEHSEGTRDFCHWKFPQIMYKNPEVQILFYKDMFPTPFVRCWLDTGEDVLMDTFGKTNVEIEDQLIKVLGRPKHEMEDFKKETEVKKDISNFGSGCARHCLCEIPGQFPCPCVVHMPKHLTGKYKLENNLMPKKGHNRHI